MFSCKFLTELIPDDDIQVQFQPRWWECCGSGLRLQRHLLSWLTFADCSLFAFYFRQYHHYLRFQPHHDPRAIARSKSSVLQPAPPRLDPARRRRHDRGPPSYRPIHHYILHLPNPHPNQSPCPLRPRSSQSCSASSHATGHSAVASPSSFGPTQT